MSQTGPKTCAGFPKSHQDCWRFCAALGGMSAGAAAAALAARRNAQLEQDAKAGRQKRLEAEAKRLRSELDSFKGKPDLMMLIRVAKAERLASGEIKEAEPPPNYRTGLERDHPADEVVGDSGKLYISTSLFCLRPHHQPRKSAIYIVESKPFDPIILITIMCNCATMAWESPLDPTGTWKEGFIDVSLRYIPAFCAGVCSSHVGRVVL